MFFKKSPHRIFDYTPRFYKPEEDKDEKRKRKLGFRRQMKIKRKKKRDLVISSNCRYLYLLETDRDCIERVSDSLHNIHYRTIFLDFFESFDIFIFSKDH